MARLILLAALVVSQSVMAASPPEQLAIETYRHLVSSEDLLQGAIRSGDKNDYQRFIWKPAVEMMRRWPEMGDPAFDKYARCRLAISQYLNYSEGQFNAAGKLPKSAMSSKDYFDQKKQCEKALKGRI